MGKRGNRWLIVADVFNSSLEASSFFYFYAFVFALASHLFVLLLFAFGLLSRLNPFNGFSFASLAFYSENSVIPFNSTFISLQNENKIVGLLFSI